MQKMKRCLLTRLNICLSGKYASHDEKMNNGHGTAKFFSMRTRSTKFLFSFSLLVATLLVPCFLQAQNVVSGALAGVVTDSMGAAVRNAKIVLTNKDTGFTQILTSGSNGGYDAPLLKPGVYQITVTANGFETSSDTVVVAVGQIATGDIRMTVGSGTVTVEVTSDAVPLLHTENAEISTSISQEQVQNLPNPGNDLTFYAQVSPGAVMNNAGGDGNFSVFGLPAVSNTFTLNGSYENDPFLNLSNSGASNLLLGNNEVSEVNISSNAYGANFGGLGGAQVNEITLSGTNKFHGNAVYQWNGTVLNANDYFRNQTPTLTPRSADNVNQFAARFGGPIIKDRLFFFANYEGLRVVLPTSGTVFAPTSAYIANTINVAPPADQAFYKQIFSLYQNAKGYSTATPSATDPNAVSYTSSAGNFTHEFLFTSRVDLKLTDTDNVFGHFKWDKGVQATHTDPINPLFNSDSPQPSFEGTLGETHVINSNITNQFLFGVIWYSAVFQNTTAAAANALIPYVLDFAGFGGTFNTLGGEDDNFPQGRNVTNYQFSDDVSISHRRHTIQFGAYFRRDDVTDYSPSVLTTPLLFANETGAFAAGQGVGEYEQQYPLRNTQPVALYNLAGYAQDSWKLRPNLNITAGVRLEHDSNPVCGTNCFAGTNGAFSSLNPSTATPYSTLLTSGQHQAFPGFQAISVNPRVGFSWTPFGSNSNTVVRGGFGMFTDVFPATVADDFLNNAPTNVGFVLPGADLGGPSISANPANPTSGQTVAAASNKAFQAGFQSGASFSTLSASVPGFGAPSIFGAVGKLHYPTYEEYSFQVEQALDSKKQTVLSVAYVGNHGYHEPVQNSVVNAFGVNNGGPGFSPFNGPATPINFTGLPSTAPNTSFSGATEVGNGAISNYSGLIVGASHHTKSLTLNFNYGWSHALDEISNGGILPFASAGNIQFPENPNNLKQNYGNADYDVRQNFTASYVYVLPYYGGPKLLTDGWQASGTVFHHTGFPFSIVDSAVTATNYPVAGFLAAEVNGVKSCGGSAVFNNATGATANPCAIAAGIGMGGTPNYVDPTAFGQQRRNQVIAPAYTDTDFNITKGFKIPHLETGRFQIGAQFFNLFNHPNFGPPGNDINNPSTLGAITTDLSTPTSILGSFLGGNADPRLIQLKGVITF
jgi:Carboxypeptidase regulatory-like domain